MIIIVQSSRFVKGNFLKSYEEIVNVAGNARSWKNIAILAASRPPRQALGLLPGRGEVKDLCRFSLRFHADAIGPVLSLQKVILHQDILTVGLSHKPFLHYAAPFCSGTRPGMPGRAYYFQHSTKRLEKIVEL